MASLQQLLADDGFETAKPHKNKKQVKFRAAGNLPEESPVALPIFICHGKKSTSRRTPHHSKRRTSMSAVSSNASKGDEPAIDEVAIRAVVSILSGYIGRYTRDDEFRDSIRQKCHSCLKNRSSGSSALFANIEMGIESIERIIDNPGTKSEMRMKTLRNAISLLSIVASLNSSENPRNASTGAISACAQLYLSIVYKLEKNDRISARHLLQVFIDAPFLARTHLLPELWEHFFLPHLLHLRAWYDREVESVTSGGYFDQDEKMRALNKAFNDHMDYGTIKFALYYKEWLKVGSDVPPVPCLPSPSNLRRRSSESLSSRSSSLNPSLYQAVFGSTQPKQKSMGHHGTSPWDMEEEEKVCTHEHYIENMKDTQHRSSSLDYRNPEAKETKKHDFLQLLSCQSDPVEECLDRNNSITRTSRRILPPNSLSLAIDTISTSESLTDCENAVRVITKTWLDLHGNLTIEKTLSQAPVIEGMLEVLFVSNDDEVLEMTISVLAELVTRNDTNRHVIVYSDPNLNIFVTLLRSSSIFLKAGVLLYLLQPEAKQMISVEWVPLVLRMVEFGDQSQTLFTVECSPREAGYYLLEQLVTGFDEDKNMENARQVVSIGGLSLLAKRMEAGDVMEKTKACSIVSSCVRADGSCRHFLSKNLSQSSILELLVREMHENSQQNAFGLLVELICLNRKTQTTKFLQGLVDGWGGLNTMHILFVYLQRARVEERPIVAAVLLHLDLLVKEKKTSIYRFVCQNKHMNQMRVLSDSLPLKVAVMLQGDPLKCSVYRQEAVDTIIQALDCQILSNEMVQEQSARALLVLGGRFSYTGESTTENWQLKEAGFDENSAKDLLQGKDIVVAGLKHSHEEEDAMQIWVRKTAVVLLTSGNKRLLAALADSMANAIPSLARASLVTASWLSTYLHLTEDEDLWSEAISILVPRLIESLSRDKATEERVLASFTLLTLARSYSDCVSKISNVDKVVIVDRVRDLTEATWTANELISVVTNASSNRCTSTES